MSEPKKQLYLGVYNIVPTRRGNISTFIHKIKENGGNGIRVFGVSTWHDQIFMPDSDEYWRQIDKLFSACGEEDIAIHLDLEDRCSLYQQFVERHWLSKIEGGFWGETAWTKRVIYTAGIIEAAKRHGVELWLSTMNEPDCHSSAIMWCKRYVDELLKLGFPFEKTIISGHDFYNSNCSEMAETGYIASIHGIGLKGSVKDFPLLHDRLLLSNDGENRGDGRPNYWGEKAISVEQGRCVAEEVMRHGYRGYEARDQGQWDNPDVSINLDNFDPTVLHAMAEILNTLPPSPPTPPIPPEPPTPPPPVKPCSYYLKRWNIWYWLKCLWKKMFR